MLLRSVYQIRSVICLVLLIIRQTTDTLPQSRLGCHECGYRRSLSPNDPDRLGLLRALKEFSLERSLGVADARFNFSFSIWILDPTGQGDSAIVRQDVAIERIQNGIIDVRDEHALAQIIQDDDPRSAA
jgi:hypothetical protein